MTDQNTIYQIRIKEYLNHQWSEWFDGMTVKPEEYGTTLILGPARAAQKNA